MLQQNSQVASRQLCPRNLNSGFVLLHTLVLLLIGSALIVLVMETGLGGALDSNAEFLKLRLDSAAESGVHHALFDLLGRRSKNANGGVSQVEVDGVKVDLNVLFSDGLVSLRSSNQRQLQTLLAATLGNRSSIASESLLQAKPYTSYADLISLDGIGADGLACLFPYITLFTNNSVPVAKHAPARLRNWLGLQEDKNSGVMQEDAGSSAGSIVRIHALAYAGGHKSRTLIAEVLLTGRADQPLWVMEWLWMPSIDEEKRARMRCDG